MKESYPVEVAEYITSRKLETEPTFIWWLKKTLKKRNHAINKVKSHHFLKTHKYSIEVPTSIDHALRLDKKMAIHFGWMP